MNKTLTIGKLTLTAALGTLLWAGCASTPNQPGDRPRLETTVDLHDRGPNTYPQYGPHDMVFGNAAQTWWRMEDIE